MTPIEQANELVSQYEMCTRPLFALGDYEKEKHYNKQCALIIVEKLIDESRQQQNVLRFKYWREVKKHLDNDSTRSQESEELYPQQ